MNANPRFLACGFVACRRQGGGALAGMLHVLLLLVVIGQVVYLASRHRLRFDLTQDQLYSLSSATRRLLGDLQQRLVIEAYFSPKDDLPTAVQTQQGTANVRETRAVLDGFLDELVQLGRGKVVVQRLNPNDDKDIADQCTRLGIKPLDLRTGSTTSVQLNRHWQGLRLLYGGSRQRVLEQIAPPNSYLAEAVLTPAIKEVLTEKKRKFGYMEWPVQAQAQPGQPPQGIGWNVVRTAETVSRRYEFQNYKDDEAPLLPAECDTLFLFRPKDLTDRQKYVLDQFVLRGGNLIVFADGSEYQIGQKRTFQSTPLAWDAADSQLRFDAQLQHYGIDLRKKVIADFAPDATSARQMMAPYEYYCLATMQGAMPVQYPYFFHPVGGDWASTAKQLAKGDAEREALFQKTLRPGIDTEEGLFGVFKKTARGPGFYWPTWVDLRRKLDAVDLPANVTGRVLLWSSPLTLIEDPPANLDPMGSGDPNQQIQYFRNTFQAPLMKRLEGEPRRQAPLMVEVKGTFTSFFSERERPKRPAEIKEEEAKKKAAEEAAAKDPLTEPVKDAPDAPVAKVDEQGPPPPKTDDQGDAVPKVVPEADKVVQGTAPGRIVVIGDSDFIRDDFVNQSYARLGGPWSIVGRDFFTLLLDWVAQDRDLAELASRIPTDRTLKFLEPVAGGTEDPRAAEQRLDRKMRMLLATNVFLPCAVLLLIGLLVFLARRAQKRSFLDAIGN
ncbi:MAG: GldG family protein [Planctomycetes bacterium]|nr:GldG family protein [Planctomycetota bacterium]